MFSYLAKRIDEADPMGDICSLTTSNFAMSGKNIDDLLNGSFDSIADPLTKMLDFSNGTVIPNPSVVLLEPKTGLVTSVT